MPRGRVLVVRHFEVYAVDHDLLDLLREFLGEQFRIFFQMFWMRFMPNLRWSDSSRITQLIIEPKLRSWLRWEGEHHMKPL